MPRDEDYERYAAYTRTLAEWDALDSARVAEYVNWALELDEALGESAVIALLAHPAVTEDVLDRVEPRLADDWTAARERLNERRVRLPLERGLTDEAHQLAAVRQGSRNVQLWLLDSIELSRRTLEQLAAVGSTRAIRNRASQRLRAM